MRIPVLASFALAALLVVGCTAGSGRDVTPRQRVGVLDQARAFERQGEGLDDVRRQMEDDRGSRPPR
jgi:hypothetical protein